MLDKDGLTAEVSVGVTYTSLMSAVSLFFTGVLISQYSSFNETIKVPLIFLIISTFSFIFSATIYSNAATEITLNKLKVVEKYMIYGKNLTELLGLYPFILATPLVIGAVTKDSFLRSTTIIVAVSGFTLYSQSKFSVLERELTIANKRYLTFIMVVLTLALYYFQTAPSESATKIYSFLAIILMALIMRLTYSFSIKSKQYKPTFFRPFQDEDAAKLSEIVLRNLTHGRQKSLLPKITQHAHEQFSKPAIIKLAGNKQLFVAEFNSEVVGFVALEGNTISNVYTDPELQRKGIGRMLVEHAEVEARDNGHKETNVIASADDHEFCKRLGYQDVKKSGGGFIMKKRLRV